MSYKKRELSTLREHQGSLPVLFCVCFCEVCVSRLFSFCVLWGVICLRSVYCVLGVASISALSILYCAFGFFSIQIYYK